MNYRIQNLEETVEECLMKMRTRKVVENILRENDAEASYNQLRYVILESASQKFEVEMIYFFSLAKVPFKNLPYFVNADNIVELLLLLFTKSFDDEDFVEDVQGIAKLLLKVEGSLKGVAHQLYSLLYEGEHRSLKDYSWEELYKIIVL